MKKRASVGILVMAVGMLVACGQSEGAISEAPAIPKVSQENIISSESINSESVSSESISSENISSEIEPIEVEYWDGSKKLVVDNTLPFATIQPYGDKVYSVLVYDGKVFDELPIFDEGSNGTDSDASFPYKHNFLGFCIQDNILYYIEDDKTQSPTTVLRARLYAKPMEGREADTILLAEDVSADIKPVYQDGIISYKVYDTSEETNPKTGETEQSSVGAVIKQISATTGEVICENNLGKHNCQIYGISNDYIYYEDRDLNIFYQYNIQEGKKEVIIEDSTNGEYYFDRGNLFVISSMGEETNRHQVSQILELGKRINRCFPYEMKPDDPEEYIQYDGLKVSYQKGSELFVYDLETNQERVVAKLDSNSISGHIIYVGRDYIYEEEYHLIPDDDAADAFFYQVNKDGKKTLVISWVSCG